MPSQPKGTESPAPDAPRFGFKGIAVKRILFETRDRTKTTTEGDVRPERQQYQANLGGSISLNHEQRQGIVSMDVEIDPDPKSRPYHIEISIAGRFTYEPGTPPEQFDQFCRAGAPPILFPYVREIVHRLTRDAAYGPVLLDPINIGVLVSEWQKAVDVQQTMLPVTEQP